MNLMLTNVLLHPVIMVLNVSTLKVPSSVTVHKALLADSVMAKDSHLLLHQIGVLQYQK